MKTQEILHKIRTQVPIYKPIKGFDRYFVSSFGNVKNIKTGRILKPRTIEKGYLQVVLFSHYKHAANYVHRLVAQAFIPNPENKSDINHKDEVKSNNHLSNLEWLTHRENLNYGTRNERVSLSRKDKPKSEEHKRRLSESNKRTHIGKHMILGEDGKRHWQFLTK